MKLLPWTLGSTILLVAILGLSLRHGLGNGEAASNPEASPAAEDDSGVGAVSPGSSSEAGETGGPDQRKRHQPDNLILPAGVTATPKITLFPKGLPESVGGASRPRIFASVSGARYEFGATSRAGVLVGTCESCSPIITGLVAGDGELPTLQFIKASPVEIEVREASGGVVPGARVEVSAKTELGWWTQAAKVGPNGRAFLPVISGQHSIVASSGKQRSRVWNGVLHAGSEPVALVIAATFSAHGRVDPTPEPGGQVQVGRARSIVKDGASSTDVDRQGNWRLDDIPWEDEEFIFRFEGGGLHADEVRLRPASPGVDLDVQFKTAAGIRVNVLAVSDGKPIPGARVTPIWRTLSDAFQGIGAVTDENGRATLEHVKVGTIAILGQKDGYAETIRGPLAFDEDQVEPMLIELLPGATIYGKVTHEGEPVREFTVIGWDHAGGIVKESFQSEDGSFQLARMHTGSAKITAHSSDLPPCLPIELQLSPGEEREVDLRLGEKREFRGTVVDSVTGSSLADVRVEFQLASDAGVGMTSYGQIVHTNQAGEFSITASRGPGIAYFKSEGYELLDRVVDSARSELGIIGLSLLQRAKVQLIGDDSVDLSAFSVSLHASTSIGPLSADDEGVVWFEAVDSGDAVVEVYPPGGGRIDQQAFLVPGESWEFEIPVTGKQTVEVDVVPARGQELPAGLWLMGAFGGADGRPYYSYAEVVEGHAVFDLASGTHGYLELILSTGEVLLRRSVELSEGRNYYRWELHDPKRVRLVDQDGIPYAGAYAFFGIPKDPVNMWRGNFSDAEGIVSAGDFEGDSALVILKAGTLVSRSNSLDFSRAEDSLLELVVDRESSVELLVSNADGPVSGVAAGLYPPEMETLKQGQSSGVDGLVTFPSLQAGTYRLEVGGQGWWKTVRDVEAAQVTSLIHIPARRLASLELSIQKGGIPASDATVTLISLTEGDDVSAWVTSGRVTVSGDSSGPSGRWSIQGIPDGRYRWLIEHPTATKAGEIEVVGGSQEVVCTLD